VLPPQHDGDRHQADGEQTETRPDSHQEDHVGSAIGHAGSMMPHQVPTCMIRQQSRRSGTSKVEEVEQVEEVEK
jgi:hypothetical protein